MTILNTSEHNTIKKLKQEVIDLPWYKRWFFCDKLEALLKTYPDDVDEIETKFAYAVIHSFLNDTWWFQRWFFDCLVTFSSSSPLIKSCQILNKTPLFPSDDQPLAETNFTALHNQNPLYKDNLPKALQIFKRRLFTGELAQCNFDQLMRSSHQTTLLIAEDSKSSTIFEGNASQANFNLFLSSNDPACTYSILKHLQDAKLFSGVSTESNQQRLSSCLQNHKLLNNALILLIKEELFYPGERAQAIFDALTSTAHISEMTNILTYLNEKLLLTTENIRTLISSTQAERMSNTTEHSSAKSIPDVNQALQATKQYISLAGAQAYFNLVMKHKNLYAIYMTINTVNLAQWGLHAVWAQCEKFVFLKNNMDKFHLLSYSETSTNAEIRANILKFLFSFPTALDFIDNNISDYDKDVLLFITNTLQDWRSKKEYCLINNHDKAFDVSQHDEPIIGTLIIRHLLKKNESTSQEDVRFLLSIPAVINIAHGNKNELLRLCLEKRNEEIHNEEIAVLLLKIPAVKAAAEENDYYGLRHHDADAEIARFKRISDLTPLDDQILSEVLAKDNVTVKRLQEKSAGKFSFFKTGDAPADTSLPAGASLQLSLSRIQSTSSF